MQNNELQELRNKILLIIDAIIEKEGAFGMVFKGHEFEGRYKCGNDFAYQRNEPFEKWTFEQCLELLDAVKEYVLPDDPDEDLRKRCEGYR